MSLNGFRTAVNGSRVARRERRRLIDEITSYTAPTDRRDFEAILDRYPADEVSHLYAALVRAA